MASAGQSPANGLLLVAISYVLNVVNAATGPRTAAFPDQAPFPAGAAQPLVPVPLAVDAVLSLLVGVVGMVVTIAALRLFVGEETESLSVDLFTRNGVWALLNFVAGTIVFGIVVFVGFLLLVVPGIFLLTTLFYWPVFVAVEDENFAEALQSSWELTKGSRLRVFLLGVVFFVVAFVVSVVFGSPPSCSVRSASSSRPSGRPSWPSSGTRCSPPPTSNSKPKTGRPTPGRPRSSLASSERKRPSPGRPISHVCSATSRPRSARRPSQ
ncbi:hypothetical protein [Halospeciosus flavus]|uniref:hypothetical protein n=1 Tax=Halospeciosus flavus TaxID=3032283 RepID=UPI0036159B50